MEGLCDSHAHLLSRFYGEEVEAVLGRAREAGVELTVSVATDVSDAHEALELARKHGDVAATAGVHPHEAKTLDAAALAELEGLVAEPGVSAVGECGLDYHYDCSPREIQREALRSQIRLAHQVRKPVVLHNRESDQDMLEILREERVSDVGGVLHCFTASVEMAREVLDMGLHLGFGGIVTFKKGDNVRDALALCPLDRLLVETDCPYLTPMPHRGRRNEPAYVRLVVDTIAELTATPADELARLTLENARKLFRIA